MFLNVSGSQSSSSSTFDSSDGDRDSDIDRQLMAPFGLPQPPLSLSFPLSRSVSLSVSCCPLLARQPRVCLSPAIAAVQMAHGISIIYRLWKPFTFVIYAGLTATGSLHSTHTNTHTNTHTHTHTERLAHFDIQVKLVATNTNTRNRSESHNKIIKWNSRCFFLLLSLSMLLSCLHCLAVP